MMDSRFRQTPPFDRIPLHGGTPLSLWKKAVAVLIGTALFVLSLMFSVVLFAVIFTVGAVVWGWLWWKTRAVRKQMREMAAAPPPGSPGGGGGLVIEGEVIREVRIEDDA